jgi:hypothetical protein
MSIPFRTESNGLWCMLPSGKIRNGIIECVDFDAMPHMKPLIQTVCQGDGLPLTRTRHDIDSRLICRKFNLQSGAAAECRAIYNEKYRGK